MAARTALADAVLAVPRDRDQEVVGVRFATAPDPDEGVNLARLEPG